MEIKKELKLSIDDLKSIIERKYNVEVIQVICSKAGVRCVLK